MNDAEAMHALQIARASASWTCVSGWQRPARASGAAPCSAAPGSTARCRTVVPCSLAKHKTHKLCVPEGKCPLESGVRASHCDTLPSVLLGNDSAQHIAQCTALPCMCS